MTTAPGPGLRTPAAQRGEQERADRGGPGDAEDAQPQRQPGERLGERGHVREPEPRDRRPEHPAVERAARMIGGDGDRQHCGADGPAGDQRAAQRHGAEPGALVADPER